MCRGRHEQRGRGRHGFGRHGFPSRDVWLERLQAHRAQLEQELQNVRDVIERLGPEAGEPQPEI